MKTRKTILTIALLLLAAFTAFAQQYNPESDFEVEVIDNGRAVRITGYNGNNTVVNIPPRIRNLPVTEIGNNAFRLKGLTSVTIPHGIIAIGNDAFQVNDLTSITIPNSVISIGNRAFGLNKLTSVTLPNNVITIGQAAFLSNNITEITIPNSVTSIGSSAFRDNQLTSLIIPNSVTTIGYRAFENNQLISVTIPANVTIDREAFDGGIAELYSQRGRRAFHYEQGLVFNVTLPAGNPRQADLLLGAAVFQELQVLRFLGDTAAVNRHEEVLRFITGRGNATRAEVEAFYRNGIRGIISDTVDEEFNRVSFLLRGGPRGSYNAILTRSNNGGYILSYEDARDVIIELSSPSLEALASAMRNNTADFNQTTIDAVQAQARLIPAAALSDAALNEVKTILTNFYINPNATTFTAVVEMYRLFVNRSLTIGQNMVVYENARNSTGLTIQNLNNDVARRLITEARAQQNFTVLTTTQQQRLVGLR